MRCHYTYCIEKGKKRRYLIPYCYDVQVTNRKSDCVCGPSLTPHYFEKERFNKVVAELKERVEWLENENKSLIKVIEQLK